MERRIEELDSVFERSLALKKRIFRAYQVSTNGIKMEILDQIKKTIEEIYDGFEEVSRIVDGYDDYGPIYEIEYANGEFFDLHMLCYVIPIRVADAMICYFNSGFIVNGNRYYVDTFNNLLFRLLNEEVKKIKIDDIELISQEEKERRESKTDTCREVLAYVSKNLTYERRSYYGILSSGKTRRNDREVLFPIDAGITMNLLKHYFVKESGRRQRNMHLLPASSNLIRQIECAHPETTAKIAELLEAYPVEGAYRQKSGELWERIVYHM